MVTDILGHPVRTEFIAITAMQTTFEIDAFNQVTQWLLQFTTCFKNYFKEDDAKTS